MIKLFFGSFTKFTTILNVISVLNTLQMGISCLVGVWICSQKKWLMEKREEKRALRVAMTTSLSSLITREVSVRNQ